MILRLETFKATNAALYAFTQRLNINVDAVDSYRTVGEQGLKRYNEYKKIISEAKGEKELKKLSPPEVQVLFENYRNISEFLEQLNQEVTYLVNTRHPLNLVNATIHMTTANMMLDKLLEILGITGKMVYPKLKHVRDKNWDKIKYRDQVFNLGVEFDLMIQDFQQYLSSQFHGPTEKPLIDQTYTSFIETQIWLDNEYNRVEKEGMPKAREVKLPEIIEPQLPKEGQKDQPDG
jgi:hypothetical protein